MLIAALLMNAGLASAQKYAYVDMEYIFNKLPAYKDAEKQIEALTTQLQNQLDQEHAKLQQLYSDYQNEAARLTPDQKRQREDQIIEREQQYKEQQRLYFGPEGHVAKHREALFAPIRKQVNDAVAKVAVAGGYAFVLDKSGGAPIVYANPQYDLSSQVLQQLGIK